MRDSMSRKCLLTVNPLCKRPTSNTTYKDWPKRKIKGKRKRKRRGKAKKQIFSFNESWNA